MRRLLSIWSHLCWYWTLTDALFDVKWFFTWSAAWYRAISLFFGSANTKYVCKSAIPWTWNPRPHEFPPGMGRFLPGMGNTPPHPATMDKENLCDRRYIPRDSSTRKLGRFACAACSSCFCAAIHSRASVVFSKIPNSVSAIFSHLWIFTKKIYFFLFCNIVLKRRQNNPKHNYSPPNKLQLLQSNGDFEPANWLKMREQKKTKILF